MVNINTVLLVTALVSFLLATFGYTKDINGVALGLFCLTLTLLIGN